MSAATPHPDAYEQFFKTALEYYVAGRAALICRATLVPGNLFHHAVEMLVKGQLVEDGSPDGPSKIPRNSATNSRRSGRRSKADFPPMGLSEFNQMIDELERFESIRYPDEILKHGAQIGLGWGRGRPIVSSSGTEPKYQIGMGDVDAFFGRLFPLCRMNPKAYFGLLALSEEGRAAITTANDACKDWLP